jgi:hypothetical protein
MRRLVRGIPTTTIEKPEAGTLPVIAELTEADVVVKVGDVEVTEVTVEVTEMAVGVTEAGTLVVAPMITTEDGILSTTVAYPVAS